MAEEQRSTFISAGVIPVFREKGETYFLLLRAYNYWDFPKGLVEKGEDPFSGALRELREETGLASATFPWGQDYFETAPYARGKIARYYLGEVNNQNVQLLPNPETKKMEHHEFKWVNFNEAMQMVVPRVRAVLKWAHEMLSRTTPTK